MALSQKPNLTLRERKAPKIATAYGLAMTLDCFVPRNDKPRVIARNEAIC